MIRVRATGSRRRLTRASAGVRGFCGLFPTTASSDGKCRPGQRITLTGKDRIRLCLNLYGGVTVVLGNMDLLGEFVAEFRYVGDDADHAAGNLKALDRLGYRR